ncbi:hypothetical protein SERLA73DRAFT_69153 [Serpula lacrymans var. lacrymans S7.3]|uniref:Uncharacterized protein n=2 Tax=Serpula lacrymans var. lacrymans TaxID=341189 RepID=F8PK11_SERL3|nr:uncharacterized protein SERLADRAFT_433044 [Serpula lacrymans var. lacrymans S7.9]EGO03251.1 hypothetical protein SERLA73DRAFT_69153 [Serpula lacrymans var. lacrymans S7.3]EGO29035.1 hypothetical protein SERLADRAFT_433044 [Serpula lacrymans var. lacrymans S7.9]
MSSPATLPPFGRLNLICMWLESIMYGANVILYGGCIYVIASRNKHGASSSYRLLLSTSTLSISIATAHVILSFLQLLKAFTDPAIASQPDGADKYFSIQGGNGLFVAGTGLYVTNLFLQDVVLVWRLYVVWDQNWKLCVIPVISLIVLYVNALIAVANISPPGATILESNVLPFAMTSWALDLTVNVVATCGIAYRLWQASRRITVFKGRYTYKSTIFMMIESGFLAVLCTSVIVGLLASQDIAGNVGINLHMQAATTIPLLIVVRVGFSLRRGNDTRTTTLPSIGREGRLPMIYAPAELSNPEYGHTVDEDTSSEVWNMPNRKL